MRREIAVPVSVSTPRRATLLVSGSQLVGLRQRLKELEVARLAADEAFRAYRDQYRKQVRLAAVGEELP